MYFDHKTQQLISRQIERVLIVDSNPQSVRILSDLIRGMTPCEIYSASDAERGFAVCRTVDPQLVFVEHPSAGVDGYALAKRLRRSDLSCRQAAIIMVTAEATAASIIAARDAGLHEFLRKPYTAKDLQRRLEAITLKPRDWIEAISYIGPDRRRFNSADYAGLRKRKTDRNKGSEAARLAQALRIVATAAKAIDDDLPQARRSLNAQAVELQRNPAAPQPLQLHGLALMKWCARAVTVTPQLRVELETRVKEMLAYLPPEDDSRAA